MDYYILNSNLTNIFKEIFSLYQTTKDSHQILDNFSLTVNQTKNTKLPGLIYSENISG